MAQTMTRDGEPWDSMARLQLALDGLESLPLPREVESVPHGPQADHPFYAALREGKYSPQLIEGLVAEFPDLTYVDGANGLMLTGSPGRPAYIVTAPEYVEALLQKRTRQLHRARAMQMIKVLVGDGMLTSEDEVHARQRRMAQPAFAKPRLPSYMSEITACIQAMLDSWGEGKELDVETELNALTMVIVARLLMGRDVSEEAEEFGRIQRDFMRDTLPALMRPDGPAQAFEPGTELHQQMRATEGLDGVVHRLIQEHRESADSGDLLSALVAARDEGLALDDAQLRDEVFTLLFAGSDTTGRNSTWSLVLLAQHPEIAEQLAAEARAVLGEFGTTAEAYEHLHLTRAVMLEAQRLYPPVWNLPRVAIADIDLGQWTIPAGAVALVPVWVMHRDARWWPEPERFAPERWLDQDGRVDEQAPGWPAGAWLPFGLGNRHCIAKRLAPMEVALIIAMVMREWRLELPDGQWPEPRGSLAVRPDPSLLQVRKI